MEWGGGAYGLLGVEWLRNLRESGHGWQTGHLEHGRRLELAVDLEVKRSNE